MASSIPIHLGTNQAALGAAIVVILDDDLSLLHRYTQAFKARGLSTVGFSNPEDLFRALPKISAQAVFIIDQNLAHGVTGIDIARQIADSGHSRIILNTGNADEESLRRPWITQVVIKGRIAQLLAAVERVSLSSAPIEES
jgi:DNA-binding NtrC family response regulator